MRSGSSLVLALCLLAVSCGPDSAGQDSLAEEVRGTASSLVQDVELVVEGDGAAETLAPTLESLAASLKSLAESIEVLASSQSQEDALTASLESLAESIEALASSHSQENTQVAEALRELSFATWVNAVMNCRQWRTAGGGGGTLSRFVDCDEMSDWTGTGVLVLNMEEGEMRRNVSPTVAEMITDFLTITETLKSRLND